MIISKYRILNLISSMSSIKSPPWILLQYESSLSNASILRVMMVLLRAYRIVVAASKRRDNTEWNEMMVDTLAPLPSSWTARSSFFPPCLRLLAKYILSLFILSIPYSLTPLLQLPSFSHSLSRYTARRCPVNVKTPGQSSFTTEYAHFICVRTFYEGCRSSSSTTTTNSSIVVNARSTHGDGSAFMHFRASVDDYKDDSKRE